MEVKFLVMNKLTKAIRLINSCLHASCWGKLNRADCLIVRHDVNCGYFYNGERYAQLTDTLVELLAEKGITSLVVAKPFSVYWLSKACNNPLVFNRSFLFSYTATKLRLIFGFGKIKVAGKGEKVWYQILQKSKPRVVIGIQPDGGLCYSAKKMGIKVFDLQHGIIGDDHWWYGKRAKNDMDSEFLPDGFLCWDKGSAVSLRSWAYRKGIEVWVVGNPWVKRFFNKKEGDVLVESAIRDATIFIEKKPTVMVSLQWGLYEHYYEGTDFNGIMCSGLEEAIKDTADIYNWMLRLHPIQLHYDNREGIINYLVSVFGNLKGVEWEKTSLLPLPLALLSADLHITDMSTVVIEASWLGIRSALLNPHLNKGGKIQRLFSEERRLGYAEWVERDCESIKSWISGKISLPKLPVISHETEVDICELIESVI